MSAAPDDPTATAALRPRKHWSEMTDVPPPEGGSAIEELRHTLAHYQPEPDEAFVVVATRNVYGDKITTGLTWGALRTLLEMVDHR